MDFKQTPYKLLGAAAEKPDKGVAAPHVAKPSENNWKQRRGTKRSNTRVVQMNRPQASSTPGQKDSGDRPTRGMVSVVDDTGLLDTATRLLSETAHDLRSPIAGVRQAIQLVVSREMGEINEAQQSLLNDVIGQCDSIRNLIDNMLQLDRLRSGVPAISRQWISAHELRTQSASVIDSVAAVKRVEVVWQGFDDASASLYADVNLMRRLLINLAGNAVAISKERTRVLISLRPSVNRGMSRLMVSDHGPGMPSEAIAHLAQRGQSGTGGTGLGLAIGMSLAALHFGRLIISTQQGHGTRIGIELPSAGPVSVADAFSRWRETNTPARGKLTSHPNETSCLDGALRVDPAEPLKPGTFKNESQLSYDGRGPRFPFQLYVSSLRLDTRIQPVRADEVDAILQLDQRMHELVYRTDIRRWVVMWDSSDEEAARRVADLNRKIGEKAGVEQLSWQISSIQSIGHRGDRSRIRENLVRDTLHASSRPPVFENDFVRDGQWDATGSGSDIAARRLDQELLRLHSILSRQSERLQRQANELGSGLQ